MSAVVVDRKQAESVERATAAIEPAKHLDYLPVPFPYPDARSALASWYSLMKRGAFRSFAHLRETFPSADIVGKLTVFNVGGNKVRLIAALHDNRKRVSIRGVLTHAEYDTGAWKQ